MTNRRTIYNRFLTVAAAVLMLVTILIFLADMPDEQEHRWMRAALAVALVLAAVRVRLAGQLRQFWLFMAAAVMLFALVVIF